MQTQCVCPVCQATWPLVSPDFHGGPGPSYDLYAPKTHVCWLRGGQLEKQNPATEKEWERSRVGVGQEQTLGLRKAQSPRGLGG